MAAQSSIPARKILWTEEPDSLQSMGLQSQTEPKLLSTAHLGYCLHRISSPGPGIYFTICVWSVSNAEMVVGCGEYSLGIWF